MRVRVTADAREANLVLRVLQVQVAADRGLLRLSIDHGRGLQVKVTPDVDRSLDVHRVLEPHVGARVEEVQRTGRARRRGRWNTTGTLAVTFRVTAAAPGPVGFGTLPVDRITHASPIPSTLRSLPHQCDRLVGPPSVRRTSEGRAATRDVVHRSRGRTREARDGGAGLRRNRLRPEEAPVAREGCPSPPGRWGSSR